MLEQVRLNKPELVDHFTKNHQRTPNKEAVRQGTLEHARRHRDSQQNNDNGVDGTSLWRKNNNDDDKVRLALEETCYELFFC